MPGFTRFITSTKRFGTFSFPFWIAVYILQDGYKTCREDSFQFSTATLYQQTPDLIKRIEHQDEKSRPYQLEYAAPFNFRFV
jgi:hypothetical protein